MVTAAGVIVGIDPHKKTHTAVLIDATSGRQVGQALTVPDDPAALARLRGWAAKHAPGQPVCWAIEDGRGLASRLADALAASAGLGETVVWVPVRLMVAERRHTGPSGKSDALDALAAAKAAANPDNARWISEHRLDAAGVELAPLVDERAALIGERTRLISQMRWRLHQLAEDLEPASLTTQKAPRDLTKRLQHFPDTPLRQVLLANCARLGRLTTEITTHDADLDTRTRALCPALRAIYGVGAIVAATILAELGDPTRVRTTAAFARLAGVAPIPASTSNTNRHRLDRGGNRRLNHALHITALVQARTHPRAQALLTRHRHTKGHRGAIRILKRHLSDVIYHALTTDHPHPTSQPTAT